MILKFSTNIDILRCYILSVQRPWLSSLFPALPQDQGHFRLPTLLLIWTLIYSPPPPRHCVSSLPRPEKNGTTTGIDTICTYRSDYVDPKLDREQLYWEMSRGTHGVTQLGSFTLDKDSLYINGEHPFCNHKLKLRICTYLSYVIFCLSNLL